LKLKANNNLAPKKKDERHITAINVNLQAVYRERCTFTYC